MCLHAAEKTAQERLLHARLGGGEWLGVCGAPGDAVQLRLAHLPRYNKLLVCLASASKQ